MIFITKHTHTWTNNYYLCVFYKQTKTNPKKVIKNGSKLSKHDFGQKVCFCILFFIFIKHEQTNKKQFIDCHLAPAINLKIFKKKWKMYPTICWMKMKNVITLHQTSSHLLSLSMLLWSFFLQDPCFYQNNNNIHTL